LKNLRAGLVGYGLGGRVFHAPLLIGAGFEVAGILTNSPERIASAKADFPGSVIVSTMDELLALSLDLVVISSANQVHAEQALQAISAGVATVIDKPVGRNLPETKAILAAAESAGVKVSAFFNRRWDSDALTVKRIIRERSLGPIHRYESRFERYKPELNSFSWRDQGDPESGGGWLLDIQTHLVAGALDLFGPAEVAFAAMRNIRGASDDDVIIVLHHLMGVDSYLTASAVSGFTGPRVRLSARGGTLVIGDLDPQEELLKRGEIPHGGAWSSPTNSEARLYRGDNGSFETIPSENGSYVDFYLQVRQALTTDAPMPIPNKDALEVARLIDIAREISLR
jgi:predicted dehydrogenase